MVLERNNEQERLHQDVIEALKVTDDKEAAKPKISFHEQEEPAENEEFQKETQPDPREQGEPMAMAHIASEEESQNQCRITQASNTLPKPNIQPPDVLQPQPIKPPPQTGKPMKFQDTASTSVSNEIPHQKQPPKKVFQPKCPTLPNQRRQKSSKVYVKAVDIKVKDPIWVDDPSQRP